MVIFYMSTDFDDVIMTSQKILTFEKPRPACGFIRSGVSFSETLGQESNIRIVGIYLSM